MRPVDADELPLGKFVEPRTEWHKGWNDALDSAMLQAPTIEPYGTWIPCSERLPEFAGQMVLATLENIYGQRRVTTIFTSYSTKPFWCCNNPEYDLSVWKVIAWMPLPEPYREVKKDGNEI